MSTAGGVRFAAGSHTRTGSVRRENEDHLLVDTALGLFIVSDASGSWFADFPSNAGRHGAGVIQRVVRERLATDEPRSLIERAFRVAGESLRALPEEEGGAASVALALIRGGQAHVSWLGDVTAHRISGERVEALTWPHTLGHVMLRMGLFTEAVAQQHPGYWRVLAYSLGIVPGSGFPDPLEVVSFTPEPDDRLVLTTDGVHDNLPPSQLLAACRSHPDPQACAEHIVAAALERGSRDNCTCVVIAFDRTADGPPPDPPRPWWRFW